MEWIGKEAVVFQFKVLARNLPGETQIPRILGLAVFWRRFEPSTYREPTEYNLEEFSLERTS